jgi:hypothetical protein
MMRRFLCVGMLALSVPAIAAESEPRLTAQMAFDEQIYRVSAALDGPLTIECIEGCAGPVRFSDDPGGTAIGMFRLTDADNLVYTTWVSGSAYRTAVYAVGPNGVHKVFSEYSLGAVDLLGAVAGGPVIRVKQFVSQGTRKTVVRSWRWNAARKIFVRI